jgi:hypothetical protein
MMIAFSFMRLVTILPEQSNQLIRLFCWRESIGPTEVPACAVRSWVIQCSIDRAVARC